MDFEAMAREIMHAHMGNSLNEIRLTSMRLSYTEALRAAYAAGREDAAKVADEEAENLRVARSNANAFNDRRESDRLDAAASAVEHVAASIRALPGKEGGWAQKRPATGSNGCGLRINNPCRYLR
jgi:hypothetical protein